MLIFRSHHPVFRAHHRAHHRAGHRADHWRQFAPLPRRSSPSGPFRLALAPPFYFLLPSLRPGASPARPPLSFSYLPLSRHIGLGVAGCVSCQRLSKVLLSKTLQKHNQRMANAMLKHMRKHQTFYYMTKTNKACSKYTHIVFETCTKHI